MGLNGGATLSAPEQIAYIKSVGSIEARQLNDNKWRAYIVTERTPSNPRYCSYDREVVRDNYGYIITEPSLEQLIDRLKREYPGWDWE